MSEVVRSRLLHMSAATLIFDEASPSTRNVADELNALVHDCIVQYAQAGWLPDWRIADSPDWIEVCFDYALPLNHSYVTWARSCESFPSVRLGVHRRDSTSIVVQWALAHELCHCYVFPIPDSVELAQGQAHNSRPWEVFADEVAGRVVPEGSRAVLTKANPEGVTWATIPTMFSRFICRTVPTCHLL